MDNKPLKPAETLEVAINTGVAKANSSIARLIVLGILAGAFIALAAQGSTMASFGMLGDPESFGAGKALQGAVFGSGLVMVVLAGGELFTGNVLLLTSLADKQISIGKMLRNWIIVYLANLAFVNASGAAPEALKSLTWSGFFVDNLIPVTLGNIVGGGVFVAMAYWYSYRKA